MFARETRSKSEHQQFASLRRHSTASGKSYFSNMLTADQTHADLSRLLPPALVPQSQKKPTNAIESKIDWAGEKHITIDSGIPKMSAN